MLRESRSWRFVLTASACIVAFELAALSDFDGARADDLDLLRSFGTAAGGIPPNILFVLDSSGSMEELVCSGLPSSDARRCTNGDRLSLAAPNSSTICKNDGLERVRGRDPAGTGINQAYVAPYQSDGTTYNSTRYPVYYTSGSDTYFPTGSVYQEPWSQLFLGTGTTTQDKINDAIADACAGYGDCRIRSRCIYSFRTLGYHWERGDSNCGSGDPMGICGTLLDDGLACAADNECKSNRCRSSLCAAKFNNGDACTSDGWCRSGNCNGSSVCEGAGNLRLLGDFLNFYPPKGIGLIGTVFNVVHNMGGDARMGFSDFQDATAAGSVQLPIAPVCSIADDTECLDGDPATTCFDTSGVDAYLPGISFSNYTPLAKALDNAGKSFTLSGALCEPDPECGAPANFVVVITDGMPYSDAANTGEVPFVNGKITGFSDAYYTTSPATSSYLDDVAYALTQIDHRVDYDGLQAVNTYVVSFGVLDSTGTECDGLLKTTAIAGGGRCLPAVSATELQDALLQVVAEIVLKARGYTAPAVPTTRYSASTSLSSAIFRPSLIFPLWEGHVFGFSFCDESISGATCDCPSELGTVCVLDTNDDAVVYDDSGYLTSTPYWDAALCLAGDPTGGTDVPAVPMDQSNLTVGDTSESGCYLTATQRRIYTAVDTADGGTDVACSAPDTATGGCTTGDAKIAFTAANVASNTAFATALAGATTAASQKVVNFFRGFDVDDLNGNGSTTDERNLENFYVGGQMRNGWWKLGDIFHSIPNVVERPTGRGMGAWASTTSYQGFKTDNESRIRAMLVGANDGMVHAFNTGTWDASANSGNGAYDNGTGEELWAFVSPEMLPKLKTLCDPTGSGCNIVNHKYLVDGSVMVRDIWTGGTADKNTAANKSYWRTVAIYGHRDGGSTFVALDVTNIENPIYLWQFPQPGTSEASAQGRSWLDTFPAPASIGPLRVQTSLGAQYDRWVVMLSGGFDPTNRKGNVLYMLDAYTGVKLWSATKTASSADTDHMRYSFPATPVYYSTAGGSHPYIAGVVAADHGGQIWHIPINTVPVVTATPYTFTPDLVFRTTDPLIPTDLVGGDNDSQLDAAEYQTRPFYFAPTLTRHRGRVRVIIASGDRDQLIPRGTLPPTDGTAGSECVADADCDTGLYCNTGRCSTCRNSADCGGFGCVTTGCLHSFCANSDCTVELEAAGLPPAINTAVCSNPQRLYAINLDCVPTSGNAACLESNLRQITFTDPNNSATSTFAVDGDQGWYYVLGAGEKAATPFEILGGYAMYTTFLPTNACGVQTSQCSTAAKGEARLYARHYVTGKPLDWDNNNTISSAEVAQDLGEGVPTAPAVSVAISGGQATPTLIGGGSDEGLVARSMQGMAAELLREIMRMRIPRALHDALH